MRTSLNGPVILFGNDNPQQISDTDSGPNIDYQSSAIIDSRYASQATDAPSMGGVLCWNNPGQAETISAVPQANSAAVIAAAQTPTVGGFFTLASAPATGIAINIPLVPQGTAIQPGATTVPVIALDFGFAVGTTTTAAATANVLTITGPSATPAGSGTATYATRFFYPGQKIIVASAGNTAGTLPLLTSVLATDRYAAPGQALAAAGTIVMANPALFAGTGLPIGTSDQEYCVAVKPVIKAGAARVYDPAQMLTRNVTVTASGASTGTVTVRGYDIYEQPMSQTITIVGTGISTTGTKAFAYISSVQLNTGATLSGTLSVGTGGLFGLPVRADAYEYQYGQFNGAAITTGYTYADQTTPATATTGDVRGTVAVTGNGASRLFLLQTMPIAQAARATNIDTRGMVGVTNA